jgi:hypothetical protein
VHSHVHVDSVFPRGIVIFSVVHWNMNFRSPDPSEIFCGNGIVGIPVSSLTKGWIWLKWNVRFFPLLYLQGSR